MRNIKILFILFIIIINIFACKEKNMKEPVMSYPMLDNVSDANWKKLSEKRIFFGHQSVGNNILDGIREVLKGKSQIKLQINEITDGKRTLNFPGIWHVNIGKNRDPISKIDSFNRFMEDGIGKSSDLAFFKFCYVDIFSEDINIQDLFNSYREMMLKLKYSHSDKIFIHVTMPLRTAKPDLISVIKGIIGKRSAEYKLNIKRNQYNDLLRKEYEGKEPIFDLAAAESTLPNGSRTYFESNGIKYYILATEYSSDGGHLNKRGQIVIAEKFILFLVNMSKD